VYADMAAPLELLSSLTRLQQLLLADWSEPPSAAGEEGHSWGWGCYKWILLDDTDSLLPAPPSPIPCLAIGRQLLSLTPLFTVKPLLSQMLHSSCPTLPT
jgi:hypothetical protein